MDKLCMVFKVDHDQTAHQIAHVFVRIERRPDQE